MSYPQTLIPKRRVRGPMDELLPDGSTVLEALQRLQRPSMAPVLAEQPPVMPDVPTRMIVPPIGNEPLTRPRLVTPPPITGAPDVRGMSPEIINSALKRISPGTLETDTQPTDSTLQLQRPIPLETINGSVPIGAMPESLGASRSRLVLPVNPLQRAAENYQASLSAPPDYGQDSQGNQRTQAKRGWAGRTLAALKTLGMDMLQGRGLIASAADATHAAINPDILAKRRLLGVQGQNQQEYGNQIGIAGEREKIADAQSQRLYRDTMAGQIPTRAEQATERINLQRRSQLLRQLTSMQNYKPGDNPAFDAQLQQAGIQADEFDKSKNNLQRVWVKGQLHTFNPKSGAVEPVLRDGQPVVDPTKIPVEEGGLWVNPGTALTARATAQGRAIAQSDKSVEDTNRINDVTDNNAVIDSQISRKQQDLQAAQAELYGLEQASKAVGATGIVVEDSAKLDAARKKVQGIQDDIGALQRQKKVVPLPRTQGASPASAPRGRALQRVDSSSLDNQVKTHFDKGGKAIRVRDVRTGKETLVDNYNDYLAAIGRR